MLDRISFLYDKTFEFEALFLVFRYYKKQKQALDNELICLLRVKPDDSITQDSLTCQLLDPINVSSTSMYEDGEQLISRIVHIAPSADNTSKVPLPVTSF